MDPVHALQVFDYWDIYDRLVQTYDHLVGIKTVQHHPVYIGDPP